MPPKATVEGVESGRDVMLLINFIRTAKDFKPDLAEMAQLYGIADKKNVPRKINKVLAPHGFRWNAGKIEVDGVPEDDGGEDGEDVVPMTPAKATRKATRTPKSKGPKTPTSNKKRKIEEEEPEEEDAEIAKSIDDEAVETVSKDDDDNGEAIDTAMKRQASTEED